MTAYIRFLQNGMPIHGAVRTGPHAGWSEILRFSMGGRTSASRPGMGLLRSLDGGRTSASAPELQEVTITKLMDASSPVLMQQSLGGLRTPAHSSRAVAGSNTYGGLTTVQEGIIALNAAGEGKRGPIDFCKTDKSAGSASQPDNLVAEVNFTAAGSRAADLRVLIHDVRVVRYQRMANAPALRTTNVSRASTTGRGVYVLSTDHIVIAYSRMTHAGAPASAPDISQDVRGRLLVGSDQGVWATRQAGAPSGRLFLGSEVGVF